MALEETIRRPSPDPRRIARTSRSTEPTASRAPPASTREPGRRCGCPFEVRAPDGTGGSRTVTLAGLTLAQARAKRRHLIVAPPPSPVVPAPEPVEPDTLTAFAASYFRAKAPVLAANTIRNREDDYRRRIAPVLGHLPLGAISREVVEVWLAELVANGASHRMVKQTVATLRVILATAVEWGRIAENSAPAPAAAITLSRASARWSACSTHEQVAALIPEGAGDLRTADDAPGSRRGGAPPWRVGGLCWADLDLVTRRLHVRRRWCRSALPREGIGRSSAPQRGGALAPSRCRGRPLQGPGARLVRGGGRGRRGGCD